MPMVVAKAMDDNKNLVPLYVAVDGSGSKPANETVGLMLSDFEVIPTVTNSTTPQGYVKVGSVLVPYSGGLESLDISDAFQIPFYGSTVSGSISVDSASQPNRDIEVTMTLTVNNSNPLVSLPPSFTYDFMDMSYGGNFWLSSTTYAHVILNIQNNTKGRLRITNRLSYIQLNGDANKAFEFKTDAYTPPYVVDPESYSSFDLGKALTGSFSGRYGIDGLSLT